MKTQERREFILRELQKVLSEQEYEEEHARIYVERNGGTTDNMDALNKCKMTIKYGFYSPMYQLESIIYEAMEMKPIGDISRSIILRHYIYKHEDEVIVKVIIERMIEQGYVKTSKSGKGFRVLKVA